MEVAHKRSANWLLLVFAVLTILELWGEYTTNTSLIIITKPLLMVPLVIWVFWNTRPKRNRIALFIFLGLNFSIIGDTSLIITEQTLGTAKHQELAFLLGLGAFLLAHVSYLAAFINIPLAKSHGLIRRSYGLVLLPLIGLYLCLLSILWGHLADMRIPVILYAAIIVAMTASAANLKGLVSKSTLQIVLGAAILFMFSDTIIALTTFRSDLSFQHSRLLIMIPYLASQMLFALGAIRLNQAAYAQHMVDKTQ